MELVVISPEAARADEIALVEQLYVAGLKRYHVRKPTWSREQLAEWLGGVTPSCRARFVLHQHHELVAEFGLLGRHWPERQAEAFAPPCALSPHLAGAFTSRSCHALPALSQAVGRFDAVLFGPVFPSLSKRGYTPQPELVSAASARLERRSLAERRTAVLALGGVTVETAMRAHALGFDGVAVLGAVWQATDPVAAFGALRDAVAAAPSVVVCAG